MDLTEFKQKNWDGENRWKRIELEAIAQTLNVTDHSNEMLYNTIYKKLVSIELKKGWEGDNRLKRITLDEMAKNLNLPIDNHNSNKDVYTKIDTWVNTCCKTTFRDFQIVTVSRMLQFEKWFDGGFLLSEAGTGKTFCAIGMILQKRLKTLIIVPAGLIDNWYNEFLKHTNVNSNTITKYYGPKRQELINNDSLVYITSYSIVAREFDGNTFLKDTLFVQNFERIILDEGHYIRNAGTGMSKALIHLSDINLNCKKWVVTATPIFNSYKDTFAYFRFLQLEGIDSRKDFTNSITKSIDGLKTLNEWIHKYSIKYTKEIVLKDLKEKNQIDININFNKLEQEFYDALYDYSQHRMKTLVKKIKIHSGSMKNLLYSSVLVFILRLKQACNSPWLILNQMKRLQGSNCIQTGINRLNFFNDAKNLKEECTICYDAMADRILDPCGHKICSGCWLKMQNYDILNCHMCREFIQNYEIN